MTCVIIASGPYIDKIQLQKIAQNRGGFYIICADGGYRNAQKASLIPDEIVGDLDSVSCKKLPSFIQLSRLDVHKDITDTRAAIELGLKRGFSNFELYGTLGGRIDHSLSNLSDLYYLFLQGVTAKIVDPYCEVFVVTGTTQIYGEPGETISFMMYGPPPKEITLKGFLYPLSNYVGDINFQIGISNVLTHTQAEVSINDGFLLMMRIKKR